MDNLKKRRPLLALFLSCLTPGLGQLYNGQIKKAIIVYLFGLLIASSIGFSGMFLSFSGLLAGLAISISFFIYWTIDAFVGAIKLKEIKMTKYNKWYLYFAIVLLTILIFPNIKFGLETYSMPGSSMDPTLMIGDYFFVDINCYERDKPKRGDMVIFKYPLDPSKIYVKRIVGLPGDWIQIVNKKVFINGELWEIPQAVNNDPLTIPPTKQPKEAARRDNFGAVVVPEGSYFVMGDNRDYSYDSRFFGFVQLSSLQGKPLYIYWSKNKARIGMEIK